MKTSCWVVSDIRNKRLKGNNRVASHCVRWQSGWMGVASAFIPKTLPLQKSGETMFLNDWSFWRKHLSFSALKKKRDFVEQRHKNRRPCFSISDLATTLKGIKRPSGSRWWKYWKKTGQGDDFQKSLLSCVKCHFDLIVISCMRIILTTLNEFLSYNWNHHDWTFSTSD